VAFEWFLGGLRLNWKKCEKLLKKKVVKIFFGREEVGLRRKERSPNILILAMLWPL
jgi:hypothetical protein